MNACEHHSAGVSFFGYLSKTLLMGILQGSRLEYRSCAGYAAIESACRKKA